MFNTKRKIIIRTGSTSNEFGYTKAAGCSAGRINIRINKPRKRQPKLVFHNSYPRYKSELKMEFLVRCF